MKRYMVAEHFRDGCFDAVYERFGSRGRMLPEGLVYIDSWVSRDRNICFQLMETNDPTLFESWTARWSDLVDFEIFPID